MHVKQQHIKLKGNVLDFTNIIVAQRNVMFASDICRMTLEHWEMILMDPNRGEWKPSDVLTINPRKSTAYLPRRNTRTSKMFF